MAGAEIPEFMTEDMVEEEPCVKFSFATYSKILNKQHDMGFTSGYIAGLFTSTLLVGIIMLIISIAIILK